MTKTLGQVAFEAWIDSHTEHAVSDTVFYTWDGQCSAGQGEDWQAAAEAVVKADRHKHVGDPYCLPDEDGHIHCPRCRAVVAKERAVIEAARAARGVIEAYMRARGVPNTTITELIVRVEALERAEKGK